MNGRVHPQKFRGVRFRKPGIWVRACVRVCVCVCVCVEEGAARGVRAASAGIVRCTCCGAEEDL